MMKVNPAITLQTWRLGYSFRDPESSTATLSISCDRACRRDRRKLDGGHVRFWHLADVQTVLMNVRFQG